MYSLRVNYFTLILLWIILLTINYCQVEVITDLQPSKSNFRPTFFTVFFFFEQIFTVILRNIIACWSRFRFFHQIILEISQLHNLIPCVRLWVINNFHPISTTNYSNSSLFFNTHSRTNPPPPPSFTWWLLTVAQISSLFFDTHSRTNPPFSHLVGTHSRTN